MTKKSQAMVSLVFPAIGAGLIYVGYGSYVSVSADNPYAEKNPALLTILIVVGLAILIAGVIVAYQMIKGKKRS